MKMAVVADEVLREAFSEKQVLADVSISFVAEPEDLPADADIIFDLLFCHNPGRIAVLQQFIPRPVFINAVNHRLADIKQPFIRINAWPGFLQREVAELVILPAQESIVAQLFKQLGWRYQQVPDLTGMVSARIIASIINEAYFTLEQGVSTKEEIDIAMQEGMHYPYGPFSWSRCIGLKKISALLNCLLAENNLYQVSALLTTEVEAAGD